MTKPARHPAAGRSGPGHRFESAGCLAGFVIAAHQLVPGEVLHAATQQITTQVFEIASNQGRAQGATLEADIEKVDQAEIAVRGIKNVAQMQGAEIDAALVQPVDIKA